MTLSEVFDTFNRVNSGIESLGKEQVSMKIETSLTPSFTVDVFSKEGPGLFTKLIRPKVTVLGSKGEVLYSAAPAGEPVPYLGTVLTVLGVLTLWFAFFR